MGGQRCMFAAGAHHDIMVGVCICLLEGTVMDAFPNIMMMSPVAKEDKTAHATFERYNLRCVYVCGFAPQLHLFIIFNSICIEWDTGEEGLWVK